MKLRNPDGNVHTTPSAQAHLVSVLLVGGIGIFRFTHSAKEGAFGPAPDENPFLNYINLNDIIKGKYSTITYSHIADVHDDWVLQVRPCYQHYHRESCSLQSLLFSCVFFCLSCL